MTHDPTIEQGEAIDLFYAGNHLVVEAGAGTGKTSTLVMMAEQAPFRHGQYIAFNKAIVQEADRKLPASCRANTAHSLAFQAVGRRYAGRLQSSRQPAARVARALGIDRVKIQVGDQPGYLAAGYLAGLVNRAIAAFCNSADQVPSVAHVPYIEGIDLPDDQGRRTFANNNAVARMLAPALIKAWDDLCQPSGALRYTHDCYLKQWQLGDPRITADYLLFDEAQDASPVMLDIVRQQADHGVQLVYVGDTQQQIYAWRGAVNALASLDHAEKVWLTQSFRFGPAIADVANMCLGHLNAELVIRGLDSIRSTVEAWENPRAVLCRTNAEAFGRFVTELQIGRHPYLVGEGKQVAQFARAVIDLKQKGFTSHPELACFASWAEVMNYVDSDPQGSELVPMVKLVDRFGAEEIVRVLTNPRPERDCDSVVSTAHQSKGREWPTVALAGDFPEATLDRPLTDEDWRLLYVSVTRAQHVLDIEAVDAISPARPSRTSA